MSSILKIVIPRKMVSTNHLYGQAKNGRRYIKEEGQLLILEIKEIMRGKKLDYDETLHFIKVEYYFYLSNFWTKKGLINKKAGDEDNYKKVLIDTITRCLGVDDSSVCDSATTKRYAEKDCTIVIISTHPLYALAPTISA